MIINNSLYENITGQIYLQTSVTFLHLEPSQNYFRPVRNSLKNNLYTGCPIKTDQTLRSQIPRLEQIKNFQTSIHLPHKVFDKNETERYRVISAARKENYWKHEKEYKTTFKQAIFRMFFNTIKNTTKWIFILLHSSQIHAKKRK